MPGAPNKMPPPETPPTPAAVVPIAARESPSEHALRRLAPSRVALRLPIWKGAPSPELVKPLEEAEAKYVAGDPGEAGIWLDRLSIRFAEPRWPSLPEPFKLLRVPIPQPQPPQWDPEHALAPAEKEDRKWQRYAETQLKLAKGSVDAEAARGTSVDDLRPFLAQAEGALSAKELGPAFWGPIDGVWSALRERAPIPASGKPSAPPPPAETEGAA